jgi:hypothetical protein
MAWDEYVEGEMNVISMCAKWLRRLSGRFVRDWRQQSAARRSVGAPADELLGAQRRERISADRTL